MRSLIFIGFIFIRCFPCFANAVDRELYFDNLSIEQGLNQSSIYSLAQDSFGFTWIGTQDGLHRFDGNTIELVPLSPSRLPQFRYIRDLKIIQQQLYVATTDGLVIIDLQTGQKSYPLTHYGAIYTVISVNNQIWLGSESGLIVLNSDNQQLTFYGKKGKVNNSLCKIKAAPKQCYSEIRSLVFDKINQRVWIGTNTGLFDVNLNNLNINNLIKSSHFHHIDSKHLSSNAIRALFIDNQQTLWMATYYGLHYLTLNSKTVQPKIQHIYQQENSTNTIISNRVLAIAQDVKGDLWFGTNKGLSRLSHFVHSNDKLIEQQWQHFFSNNASSHSLKDNVIRRILTDQNGRIWVGTNRGLSVTNLQRAKVKTYRAAHKNSINNYVLSFSEETKNKFWIGTQSGLYLFDHQQVDLLPALKNERIYDSVIIKNTLWVASRRGLFQIDLATHQVIQHFNQRNSPVGETFIYKLTRVNDNLWLATTSGLHQLNLTSYQWRSWYKKDGLVDSEVYTLFHHENKLWIGTAKGLSILELDNLRFQNYTQDNSTLKSPWIFNIVHIEGYRFLIATDGGVYEFNANKQQFDYIGITQGNAYCLIKDNQGIIWITSNNGLYQYNTSTRKAIKFDEKQGFASNEYNLNAGYKSTQGNIFVGTIDGFSVFSPNEIKQISVPLKVRLISAIQVNEQKFSLWDRLPLTDNKPVFLAQNLHLNWQSDIITLKLTNPYFALTSPISSINDVNQLSLNNMQNGQYELSLSTKADNSIYIIKDPHPLLSAWAIAIYLILFTLLIVLLVRFRLMAKFNQKLLKQHHTIVKQRDEIEQHLLFKQNLYLDIQHRFKSPVFACIGLSKQMLKLLKKTTDLNPMSVARKNVKLLAGLNDISSLIDEFMLLQKEKASDKVKVKQPVVSSIRQVESLMSAVANHSNVRLSFDYHESLSEQDYIFSSEKSLYSILENVVSNAIKFSQQDNTSVVSSKGCVKVISYKKANCLYIEVFDNGCGLSSKDLYNMCNLYYQGENNQEYQGTGVGLTVVKQRLTELNGDISFVNNRPKGTQAIIKIPLEI